MELLLTDNIWVIVIWLMVGPFIQEDVAVMAAAGMSVTHSQHLWPIFGAIMVGLLASDYWKYWIGAFARKNEWAKRQSEKPKVAVAKEQMRIKPGPALMTARFLPLARIPTYVAAGFVRVPYVKFCAWVGLSGLIYVSMVFCLFNTLGMALGEQLKTYFPLIGVFLVVTFLGVHYFRKSRNRNSSPD